MYRKIGPTNLREVSGALSKMHTKWNKFLENNRTFSLLTIMNNFGLF